MLNICCAGCEDQLHLSALAIGNPWYKLLNAHMLWLTEAKKVRSGMQGMFQVRFISHNPDQQCCWLRAVVLTGDAEIFSHAPHSCSIVYILYSISLI